MFRDVSISGQRGMQLLGGMERRHAPLSDWIQAAVRQHTVFITVSDEQYDLMFDKLEVLMALSFAYHEEKSLGWYWAPWGSFVYRHGNRDRILGEIVESISTLKHESPFVSNGIFGESPDECMDSIVQFKEFMHKVAQEMRIFW